VRLKLGGGGTLCIPAEQIMFLEEGHLCVGLLRDPRLVIGEYPPYVIFSLLSIILFF